MSCCVCYGIFWESGICFHEEAVFLNVPINTKNPKSICLVFHVIWRKLIYNIKTVGNNFLVSWCETNFFSDFALFPVPLHRLLFLMHVIGCNDPCRNGVFFNGFKGHFEIIDCFAAQNCLEHISITEASNLNLPQQLA